ncbi:MAG: hypothetical protein ACT4OP_02725 [Actinomycetota bacterium]
MGDPPNSGIFDFVPPGEEIVVFDGEGVIDGEHIGRVIVSVLTGHVFGLRWRMQAPSSMMDLDASTLSIHHPHLGEVCTRIDVRASNTDMQGSTCWGSFRTSHLGASQELDRVITHWINLPVFLPSSNLALGDSWWSGRWQFEASGWSFTLDSRPDLGEVLRAAHDREYQFVMTHVGEIRRSNGESFSPGDVKEVLFAVQLAFSFALGRWVAPAVPVGVSRSGERVWEEWAPWRCDTLHGHEAWWDTHTADDLKQFAAGFVDSYLDPLESPIVRHLAMHIIAANHGSTTAEGQVMLAIAGLEYWAWVNLVLSHRVPAKKFSNKGAAWRIRKVLREAGVPLEVPTGLDGLRQLAQQENLDGPAAVVHVPNLIVHPKDAKAPYVIDGLVWQAAQLLMEHGELVLLQRIGYRGRFMRRYPPNSWAHSSESVPWALPSATPA